MKENTDEKSLVKINENSIFYKVKLFFKRLFHKDTFSENIDVVEQNIVVNSVEDKKSKFMENIRIVEDESTILLKLQNRYRNGELKEEELTDEQLNSLCELYDKQIADLKKSNSIKKQKLLERRRKLQTNN